LSDRFGRRPILFLCLLGSAVGYLLFGLAGALWSLFLGRIIDGLTAGNMGVIQAYIADSVKPEERGKYFGRIGSFTGAGLLIGPSVGGLLATINVSVPFLASAAILTLTIVWGFFFLPESLHKEHRLHAIHLPELNPFTQLGKVISMTNLRWLLVALFLYYLPFAGLGANLTVLLKDSLGWGAAAAGIIATIVGVIDMVVQGTLVGKLLSFFGEVKLGVGSLAIIAVSYILIASVVFPFLLARAACWRIRYVA
jgi:MFS transporter, DHA1 family, tetracycline resistance protein